MLSEEDTLFADDIKAEGLGLRVVKGLGVVLAVVVLVVVIGLLVGLGLATEVVFLAAQRPGYDPEQDVPDGHLVQAFPCLYISPPM